ncbi:MAG: sigma-70 family RNA polymerase sigma factor [Planctomycetes bacterium]|nr:sigma-70 family RNA polymerase sigma factor [Planctomycetota bacterium]
MEIAVEGMGVKEKVRKDIRNELIKHIPLTYSIARKILDNKQDVEDTVQETYLQVLKRVEDGAYISSIKSYLAKTAYNLSLNKKSSQKIRLDKLEQLKFKLTNKDPFNAENAEILKEYISELSPDMQTALTLSCYHGFKYSEISEIMEIPSGTVAKKIHNAKGKLKEMITPAGIIFTENLLSKAIQMREGVNYSLSGSPDLIKLIEQAPLTLTKKAIIAYLFFLIGGIMFKKFAAITILLLIIIGVLILNKISGRKPVEHTHKESSNLITATDDQITNTSPDEKLSQMTEDHGSLTGQDNSQKDEQTITRLVSIKGTSVDLDSKPLADEQFQIILFVGKKSSAELEIKENLNKSTRQIFGSMLEPFMVRCGQDGTFNLNLEYQISAGQKDILAIQPDTQTVYPHNKNYTNIHTFILDEEKEIINIAIKSLPTAVIKLVHNLKDENFQNAPLFATLRFDPNDIIQGEFKPTKQQLKQYPHTRTFAFYKSEEITIPVPTGINFNLTCERQGFSRYDSAVTELFEGETRTINVNLVSKPAEKGILSLKGQVVDTNRNPIKGAWINGEQLKDKEIIPFKTAVTDENGNFTIEGLLDMPVNYLFINPNNETLDHLTLNNVNINEHLSITVQLLKEGDLTLQGVCVDEDGAPISGVAVWAKQQGVIPSKATTNNSGEFILKGLTDKQIKIISFSARDHGFLTLRNIIITNEPIKVVMKQYK